MPDGAFVPDGWDDLDWQTPGHQRWRKVGPPAPNASLATVYAHGRWRLQAELRRKLGFRSRKDFEAWVVSAMPWRFFARTEQLAPPGDWSLWLFMAGRGAGKTKAGTSWLFGEAMEMPKALCGVMSPTHDDLNKVTFDGPSGLMSLVDTHSHAVKRVTQRPWAIELHNGSRILSYTGEAVERLRGPQHHRFLLDEAAGMARTSQAAYEQIRFGLRLRGPKGEPPRMAITSTPKPIPLFQTLMKRWEAGDRSVVVTTATMMDNIANLAPEAVEELRLLYEGTRLGQQELMGLLLTDIPGALWTSAMFDNVSIPKALDRIVVAIDPSGAGGEDSEGDEIGIMVCGAKYGPNRDADRFYVLQDCSLTGSPNTWAKRACDAFEEWEADRIVAEANYGGAMVKSTIQTANPKVPVRMVQATRGKHVRAEPIAALYEQGKVMHCGNLAMLEGQMTHMTSAGYVGDKSPDRLDAAVWGLTELSRQPPPPTATVGGGTRVSYWRRG